MVVSTQETDVRHGLIAVLLAPVLLLVSTAALGQGLGTQFPQPPSAPATPPPFREAPRQADGRVLLSAPDGEEGLWVGGITSLSVVDHDGVPYQPWAQELVRYRRGSPLEPHTRCKPSGGPRQFLTPYGAEILEVPDLERIFIFDIGGPHTFRIIFMDGRSHPQDLVPSYYGHSIGHWEGDTLVVDSMGYNERFWTDRGRSPHTEQLHMIERFTRTDFHNMTYEVTFDDPNVYTSTWTGEFDLRFMPGQELFEYICQDNNYVTFPVPPRPCRWTGPASRFLQSLPIRISFKQASNTRIRRIPG